MVTLAYGPEKCVGCGMCMDVCPHRVFAADAKGKALVADRNACIECGACARNCPAGAITVTAGVGCAEAIINSWISGGEPSCGCGDGGCC